MVPKIAEQQKPVQRECQEAGLGTSVSVEVEVHACYILLSHACLVQSMEIIVEDMKDVVWRCRRENAEKPAPPFGHQALQLGQLGCRECVSGTHLALCFFLVCVGISPAQ